MGLKKLFKSFEILKDLNTLTLNLEYNFKINKFVLPYITNTIKILNLKILNLSIFKHTSIGREDLNEFIGKIEDLELNNVNIN